MLRSAIPVLRVSESVAAEEFYCKGLGFRILSSWRPDETRKDPCYMTVARDDARLHVHSFQSGGGLGAGAFYVFVDDVDAVHAELTSKGMPVSGVMEQTWGMREIGLRDPDGNIVTFGQRMNS